MRLHPGTWHGLVCSHHVTGTDRRIPDCRECLFGILRTTTITIRNLGLGKILTSYVVLGVKKNSSLCIVTVNHCQPQRCNEKLALALV